MNLPHKISSPSLFKRIGKWGKLVFNTNKITELVSWGIAIITQQVMWFYTKGHPSYTLKRYKNASFTWV